MKTEQKSNKIGYIYFIVILGYIVREKNQMPQGFIIVHPYFKYDINWSWFGRKISTIYSYTGVKNNLNWNYISYLNQEENKKLLHVHLQCGIFWYRSKCKLKSLWFSFWLITLPCLHEFFLDGVLLAQIFFWKNFPCRNFFLGIVTPLTGFLMVRP